MLPGFTEFDSIHSTAFAKPVPKLTVRRGSLYPLSYGGAVTIVTGADKDGKSHGTQEEGRPRRIDTLSSAAQQRW